MKELFRTKLDVNGNIYTLEIDHDKKIYKTNYNPFPFSDYITIGKRERRQMIQGLKESGYTCTD